MIISNYISKVYNLYIFYDTYVFHALKLSGSVLTFIIYPMKFEQEY